MSTRCSLVRVVFVAGLLLAPTALADVSGQVISETSGGAVEQARVGVVGGSVQDAVQDFTDGEGRFVLRGVEGPVEVVVSHPRYRVSTVTLEPGEENSVALLPKQEIFEEIQVSASRSPSGDAASPTLAASMVEVADLPVPPSTLTEAIREVPGVAENGQGGLFQVFSLRGVSRQRVMTLVSGMQVSGERRAGVSTSFIDPALLGDVEVVRGPASTWYGSGALGGVVELFPRRFSASYLETGYSTVGDERYAAYGWGNPDWSVAVAHREADDAEMPEGERLFSRYERTSAALRRTWGGGESGADRREWEVLLVPSLTEDIGKPNRDFPTERVSYPEEEHLLFKLSTLSPAGSRFYLWAHPQTLTTRSEEGASLNLVENESLDFGFDGQRQLEITPDLSARLGAEYYGRHGVDAFERDFVEGRRVGTARSLDGASLDEVAGYGSVLWRLPGATLSGGGRYTWQEQGNRGFDSVDDTAWSGFVGGTLPLPAGLQITANLGTGLRFPSLSERFFTGTTGRGEVVANPNLDPERSVSADLGLSWFGTSLYVSGHVFRNEIDDYIERIRLPSGARTFVNLTSGTVEGVELESSWQVARGWSVNLGAHAIDGEDEAGTPLADIPPDRVTVSLGADPRAGLVDGRLSFRVRAEGRDGVDEPGSGEVAIGGAFLLEASATWALTSDLDLTLRGTNLADDTYLPTADDLAVPAAGRGVGLSLAWSPGE